MEEEKKEEQVEQSSLPKFEDVVEHKEPVPQQQGPRKLFETPHHEEFKEAPKDEPKEEVHHEEKKEEPVVQAPVVADPKVLEKKQVGDLQVTIDRSKSATEQAKDLVGAAAVAKAVQDEALVETITTIKKEELTENAKTSLKKEQVESSKTEKELQEAKYGVYEGIADLIGLKKALPNGMLKVLMFILMPLLIAYYVVFGFVTGIINITMDCVNAITERFNAFAKSAKKAIVSVAIMALIAIVFLIIYYFLHKYNVISW